tara:strand:- start:8082 stop:8402 length:321 start_codon:yes stop_codon:yes gene_type:complete
MAHAIGFGPCLNCDATVEFRLNVAGRAFYRCNGSADPHQKACGLEIKAFGAHSTKLLTEKFNQKDVQHVVENRTDDGKSAAKPKAKSAGKLEPVGKPERNGDALFG